MRYRISLFYNLNMSKTAAKVCAEKYKKNTVLWHRNLLKRKQKKSKIHFNLLK